MKKGFTLVELLAVIVILAIISLIAIPQVLHLIEKSRISSLEISASEYVRAVETSLINEEINRNVPNGLYTIVDDGKAIELNGKKIQVETSGNRIESGGLLVENKKVVRIIKGKIKDYYARIENEDMKLYKEIKESMLLKGTEFNKNIKQLAGNENATSSTADTIIKEIIFLPEGILSEGITKEELTSFESTSVSSDGEVMAYYDDKDTIYVYSNNIIQTNTDATYMFTYFKGLTNITFNLLDTSNLTSIAHMFDGCENLKELDVSNFDTSKVKSGMNYVFADCKNLKKLDLSSWDVSKTGSMYGMFTGCSSLTELDLSNWNTSKVVTMTGMFQGCTKLEKLDLSMFNTSSLESMGGMFSGCSSLTTLNLSSFDTSKVKYMNGMFHDCTNLREINFGEKFDTSKVTTMHSMFTGCSSLTELDLRDFDTSSVTSMQYMFCWCSNLKKIFVSKDKWVVDEAKVNTKDMFKNCGTDTVTYVD